MNLIGLISFIVFAVLTVGAFAFSVHLTRAGQKLVKPDYPAYIRKEIYLIAATAVAFTMMLVSVYWWNRITPEWNEWLATIFGGFLFGVSFPTAVNAFIFHYWGKNLPEKLDKVLYYVMIAAYVLSAVFFFLTTDGFTDYINADKPIPNGISFQEGWAYAYFGPKASIAWYALCILAGAIFVYLLCDHCFYQEYGKHGILESTFFVAFPAGIIGARIFYVIGNFSEFTGENTFTTVNLFGNDITIWSPLAVSNGGLTILGGALTGIVVGVAWFMWRNRGKSIFVAIDIIVPTILLAQAIGRWGNFFNCEVHGLEVNGDAWKWLPKIIYNNARFSSTAGIAADGNIYVPLFLIEGIVNTLGYFVIAHVFGIRLRKYTEFGDLAFSYFIWYGLVRAIMEPTRHADYIMNDFWSWFWSLSFIAAGAILIVGNHVIRRLLKKKKGVYVPKASWKKTGLIETLSVTGASVALLVTGLILISTTSHELVVGLNQFNVGILITVCACSLLLFLFITVPKLLGGIRAGKVKNA